MRKKKTSKTEVPPAVHQFLSRNGRRGGLTTKKLIELGQKQAERSHTDVAREVDSELGKKAG